MRKSESGRGYWSNCRAKRCRPSARDYPAQWRTGRRAAADKYGQSAGMVFMSVPDKAGQGSSAASKYQFLAEDRRTRSPGLRRSTPPEGSGERHGTFQGDIGAERPKHRRIANKLDRIAQSLLRDEQQPLAFGRRAIPPRLIDHRKRSSPRRHATAIHTNPILHAIGRTIATRSPCSSGPAAGRVPAPTPDRGRQLPSRTRPNAAVPRRD